MKSAAVGVRAYIQQHSIHCIYIWCLSHRFNLVVKKATNSIEHVTNILDMAEDSAKLFRGSHIRMNIWIDVANSIPNFNSKQKLKLIGTSRWSSKQNAIATIISREQNLYVLIKSLVKLCNLPNLTDKFKTLQLSSNILNFWLEYENVVMTFLLHKMFSIVQPTTKYLQTSGLNILDGINSLKASNEKLENFIGMLDQFIQEGDQLVEKVNCLLANDVEIQNLNFECEILLPTEDEKQIIFNEIKNNCIDFIQYTDKNILSEFYTNETSIIHEMLFLDPKFAENNGDLSSISLKKICAINNIMEKSAVDELKTFFSDFLHYQNQSKYESILKQNSESENESGDDDDEEEEIHLIVESESDLEDLEEIRNSRNIICRPAYRKKCYCFECILKYISADERSYKYENIYKIYKYFTILPSTQVKCERDFSKMKIIKSRLRSSLNDETLENLLIISVENKMFENINLNDLIDDIVLKSERISLWMLK